jgi:hypothetical protein
MMLFELAINAVEHGGATGLGTTSVEGAISLCENAQEYDWMGLL